MSQGNRRNASGAFDPTAQQAVYNADHPYSPAPVRPKQKVEVIHEPAETVKNDQKVKSDAGKPKLSLVPMGVMEAIAVVREYGVRKYGDPDNWKQVSTDRINDAMLRHMTAYIRDWHGADTESGIPNLFHLACNVAFLCERYLEGKL